ncbi:hypothetical protein B14911_14525 [Bacillus sp. NRRL B-14911]|nr:hypothetical protein B14911_14525 [Bacillus sp. NRRL B-14911]
MPKLSCSASIKKEQTLKGSASKYLRRYALI